MKNRISFFSYISFSSQGRLRYSRRTTLNTRGHLFWPYNLPKQFLHKGSWPLVFDSHAHQPPRRREVMTFLTRVHYRALSHLAWGTGEPIWCQGLPSPGLRPVSKGEKEPRLMKVTFQRLTPAPWTSSWLSESDREYRWRLHEWSWGTIFGQGTLVHV